MKVKANISLTPEVLKRLDRFAEVMGMNRSQFITWSLTMMESVIANKDLSKDIRKAVKKVLD